MEISEQEKLKEQRKILDQTPAWFICQSKSLCRFIRMGNDTPFWSMCNDTKLCSCAIKTRNNEVLDDQELEYLKARIGKYKSRIKMINLKSKKNNSN